MIRTMIAAGASMLTLAAAPATARTITTPGVRVEVTETTASLHRALTRMPDVTFGPVERRERTIWVDDQVRYQRVLGFGAAVTDSSAWLLWDELPTRERDRVMVQLFGPGGIGLDYMRVPIGASDFTATGVPYTYDDMPAGGTDPTLAHFSIAHDEAYILPLLRQMLHLVPDANVLAEPWSAPGWMKANDALDNVDYGGDVLASDYQPFADYFVRFIEAYAEAGVPVAAVTPANEADWETEYPGMNINADQFTEQNLVPALRAAGLPTKAYAMDGSGFPYAEEELRNPALMSDIAGLAWHCYAGLEQMSMLHAIDPDAGLIMSECSPGIVSYPTAETAIVSLDNYAQAVDLWNLALDPLGGPKQQVPGCSACQGLVTVNEATRRAALNINYYELGQVSRFVQRGGVRIAATRFVTDYADASEQYMGGPYGVTAGLDDTAALNPDGSRVLVCYDNSTRPVRFQVAWRHRAFTYRLAPGATVTFDWKQAGRASERRPAVWGPAHKGPARADTTTSRRPSGSRAR